MKTLGKLLTGLCLLSLTLAALVVACDTAEPRRSAQSREDALVDKSRADAALMWAATSPGDRSIICADLDRYGWDWTAEHIRAGAPADQQDATDWDVVVAYIVEECP